MSEASFPACVHELEHLNVHALKALGQEKIISTSVIVAKCVGWPERLWKIQNSALNR